MDNKRNVDSVFDEFTAAGVLLKTSDVNQLLQKNKTFCIFFYLPRTRIRHLTPSSLEWTIIKC